MIARMQYAVCICAALLAGCATQPEVRVVAVEKKVPILTPCIPKIPTEPRWARGDVDLKTADADRKMAAMESELIQREVYEGLMKAAMEECKK